MKQAHFFTLLSWAEWKTLFSISFVTVSDHFKDAYPISEYPSPDCEGPTNDWLELMLRSARFLGLKHGFKFQGLQVRENGSVGGPVVEPGNENCIDLLRTGLPNLPLALSTAIDTLLEHDVTFDVSPLKAALAQIHEDVERFLSWGDEADPEGEILGEMTYNREHAYQEARRTLGLGPEEEGLN